MVENLVSSVHGLLLDHLPLNNAKTPSGWITFNCPMCTDKRKRGGVKQDGGRISYHCFNCGYKTGWSMSAFLGKKFKALAKQLGATDQDIHGVLVELMSNSEELDQASNVVESFNPESREYTIIDLPEDAVLLDELPANHELVQYAKSRGIYGLHPLYHLPDVVNKRRIVIPCYFKNELVGTISRHIDPPKNVPKYLDATQPGYVFNIDKFMNDDREIIIVVEGVLDAIMIDGLCVFGNSVTPEQAYNIQRLNKRIIVCPDRDEAGKNLILQSMALGWEVSFPPWAADIKDAADACARYGRVATVASIIKHATNNDIKKEVMMRMM